VSYDASGSFIQLSIAEDEIEFDGFYYQTAHGLLVYRQRDKLGVSSFCCCRGNSNDDGGTTKPKATPKEAKVTAAAGDVTAAAAPADDADDDDEDDLKTLIDALKSRKQDLEKEIGDLNNSKESPKEKKDKYKELLKKIEALQNTASGLESHAAITNSDLIRQRNRRSSASF